MRSGMPSPSMSAHVAACGSVNVTSPAFLVMKLSMTMCSTNEMLPLASRFCSHQAMPNPCPSIGPTASIETVAVDVESADLRAAGAALRGTPAAERRRVHLPRATGARRRLLPPAVRVQEIHAAVAVDVGDAEAVADVDAPGARLRDIVRGPQRRGIRRIPLSSDRRSSSAAGSCRRGSNPDGRRRRCP